MAKIDDVIGGLAPLSLHSKDRVWIYSLDCHLVRSATNVPADPTTLKQATSLALRSWRMSGRGRRWRHCQDSWNLWDSLASVTQTLYEQPGRRVILVVTDGVDRGSKNSWNTVREFAQTRGVAIFGLIQPADRVANFRTGSRTENIFNSFCELTGGMVLTATQKDLAEQLKRFTTLVRGRYIVEFPRPGSSIGGTHNMDITIEKSQAFIRSAGISVPVEDPAILKDPTTVLPDPSSAPAVGKRKVLAPHESNCRG
jgi:hypothetical protein